MLVCSRDTVTLSQTIPRIVEPPDAGRLGTIYGSAAGKSVTHLCARDRHGQGRSTDRQRGAVRAAAQLRVRRGRHAGVVLRGGLAYARPHKGCQLTALISEDALDLPLWVLVVVSGWALWDGSGRSCANPANKDAQATCRVQKADAMPELRKCNGTGKKSYHR